MEKDDAVCPVLTFGLLSQYRSCLMALALLSILLFHYTENAVSEAARTVLPGFLIAGSKVYYRVIGSCGVDIFAFLSGLGIHFSLSRVRTRADLAAFYRRRIRHLLVPYILVGGIFWTLRDIVFLRAPARFLHDFLFLSFWLDGVITVWYIPYQMAMYLLAPLLYKCFHGRNGHGRTLYGITVALYAAAQLLFAILYPPPDRPDRNRNRARPAVPAGICLCTGRP